MLCCFSPYFRESHRPFFSRAQPRRAPFPPYWFLGIYQRSGWRVGAADFHNCGIGWSPIPVRDQRLCLSRGVSSAREVPGGRSADRRRRTVLTPLNDCCSYRLVRSPIGRAVFHFINQTLLRLPRYRIYLVLYGGVGLSVLMATVLR